MLRRTAHAVAATMLAALLISALLPVQAALAAPSRRVVVLLAPYLSWTDITGGMMPNAAKLAARSLLADVNVRADAVTGASTPDKGAILLSAGAQIVQAASLSAFSATEAVGPVTAIDAYRQYFGLDPGPARILYLGQPEQVRVNVGTETGDAVGALGAAVHEAGGRTAAIGCGDPGLISDPFEASRPAAEAAADESGRVDLGDVSGSMLQTDSIAPFGARADTSRILGTYREVLSGGADLVVVDPGDLSRASEIAAYATTGAAEAARVAAVRATDDVLGGLVSGLRSGDAIVVLSQAVGSDPGAPAGYGPLLIAGPGGSGLGTAASTHRDGIVTEMDVSSAIVELLGAPQPATMVGSPVQAGERIGSGSLQDRVAYLEQLETTSVAVESVRQSAVNAFILLAVIVLLGSALLLQRAAAGLPTWLPVVARGALLLLVCLPLAGVLQFLVVEWPTTGSEVVTLLVVIGVVCLAVAWFIGRGRQAAVPLIAVTSATVIVLLVDQWVGGPLSFAQVFGYSPLVGARYYGMGNEMAGLLLGSVFVAVALLLDTWRDAPWARHVRTWGWPLIGVVTLMTAAAPFWGANFGPIAWMTVGFLTGWMLLNGRKVWTWRNLAIVVGLVVLILAGLSAIDLLRGAASETHLGRAVGGVLSGGAGGLWVIIVSKAETNVAILGRTNWRWLLVAVLVLLGYMRWRPRGDFAALLKEYPAYSAVLGAALFAGVASYFTEDSGIIIPALMFIPVGVTALYLMLSRPHEPAGDGS